MDSASYTTRRGEIERCFDRAAVAAWERLTRGAPVGRIRATVRAGRDPMRGAALWALVHTRNDLSVAGAYCAFTCALLVWAWQELAFLLGVVTGPRRSACPPGAAPALRSRRCCSTSWH